ncbi:hypothetical protein, variant [Aphanomyces astaci]|nr:hypothetical protein, variant [Aphanomyces astaci]ETV89350.1 hypothetical protein, variant [Aphanomyces astaci]|eukprot:XP_009821750.1 hypothetical protein, variant [Aphanomyces astaci]
MHRSWNGENCDSTAFSRLSTSAKVVLLENDSIQATVLGTTPLFNPNARIRCLESEIMANAGTPQAGMHMMLLSHEALDNSTQVATAKVGYARVASAGLQEGIMTPSQRRERLFLDTASQQANAVKKTAEMKERRLTQIMQHRYRCGVLGLDGPTNSESVTYATSAANIDKKRSHDERQHHSREEHLQRHMSIIPALGYSYLSHDMAVKPPHVTKVCQEKIKLHGKHPDTHLRIFNETPPVWHTERAQHLRDQGQAGRPYDIVNKARIEHFPPSIREKEHPRQAHPSMAIHSIYKRD